MIAADERRKDTVSATELNTALGVLATKATRAITVPVLDLLGSHDFTTCGTSTTGTAFNCSSGRAVVTQEAPVPLREGPAACLRHPRLPPGPSR